jgi:hypothetical protein
MRSDPARTDVAPCLSLQTNYSRYHFEQEQLTLNPVVTALIL